MNIIEYNQEIQHKIRETIKEVNHSLSLTTDDLIKSAEKETKTRDEYIAYMKGAAFIFYRLAHRENPKEYGTPAYINNPQDAIRHCIKLLPFMAKDEKMEHIMLVDWLNELLEFRGEEKIDYPKEYYNDKQIQEAFEAFGNMRHHEEHEILGQKIRLR